MNIQKFSSFFAAAFLAAHGLAQTTYPSLIAEGNAAAIRIGVVENNQAAVVPDGSGSLVATISNEGTTPHMDGWGLMTFLHGSGTARFGSASGSIAAIAEDKPETITTQFGSILTNPTSCEVRGFLNIGFNDSAVVTSSTLPQGTPVRLTITHSLESVSVYSSSPPSPGPGIPQNGTSAISHFQFAGGNWHDVFGGVSTFTWDTQVGATVSFTGYLALSLELFAGRHFASGMFFTKSEGSIDAGQTARYYIDTPPGVSLVTASGHSYASVSNPPPPVASSRLWNFSSRAFVRSGGDVAILGFVLAGPAQKQLLVRAVGPKLADYDVEGALADPVLTLKRNVNGTYVDVAANDNWENSGTLATATAAAGAFALDPGSLDAALAADLVPGQYTAVVSAKDGGPGVALLELYDPDTNSSDSRLVNLSTRAYVGTGGDILISGLVVSDEGPISLLIRAIGPTLSAYDVGDAISDPQIHVYKHGISGSGAQIILSNDNWGDSADAAEIATAAQQAGAFALEAGSKDAALLATLQPGTYTVHVSGVGTATGTALVEFYEAP